MVCRSEVRGEVLVGILELMRGIQCRSRVLGGGGQELGFGTYDGGLKAVCRAFWALSVVVVSERYGSVVKICM